jgi:hypothetical protein
MEKLETQAKRGAVGKNEQCAKLLRAKGVKPKRGEYLCLDAPARELLV